MKTVSVLFPDSTHGKFAVKPGDTFEHLFTKACTKRELDTAHHEMAVNKRAVPLEQVVDADALADAEVKVRVKRHSMMEVRVAPPVSCIRHASQRTDRAACELSDFPPTLPFSRSLRTQWRRARPSDGAASAVQSLGTRTCRFVWVAVCLQCFLLFPAMTGVWRCAISRALLLQMLALLLRSLGRIQSFSRPARC